MEIIEMRKILGLVLIVTTVLSLTACGSSGLYKDGKFTTSFKTIAKECNKNLNEDGYTLGSLEHDEDFGNAYYPILFNGQDTGVMLEADCESDTDTPEELKVGGESAFLPYGLNCAAKVLKSLKPEMTEEETEKAIIDLSASPKLHFGAGRYTTKWYIFDAIQIDDLYIILYMDANEYRYHFQNFWSTNTYYGADFVRAEYQIDRDNFYITTSDGRDGITHTPGAYDYFSYECDDIEDAVKTYKEFLDTNYEYKDDASGVRRYIDSEGNQLYIKSSDREFTVYLAYAQ